MQFLPPLAQALAEVRDALLQTVGGSDAAALEQFEQRYSNAPEDAAKLVQYGESTPPESIPKPQLAAYTMLGNLLLNLDETITKG